MPNQEKEEHSVSGKKSSGESWINPEELESQEEFRDDLEKSVEGYTAQGTGHNLYGRTDLDEQHPDQDVDNLKEEQILEALERSPEVDASHLTIDLQEGGVVVIEGKVKDINESRMVESIIKNIKSVKKIINHLE